VGKERGIRKGYKLGESGWWMREDNHNTSGRSMENYKKVFKTPDT
jgi:hypothetical protein